MQISLSNNPIDKLDCFLHNKIEELSRVMWLMGKRKKVKCRICGDVLDSYKDMYSPMQAGWKRVGKYTWVCHNCLEHRNFRPFIEAIDEADRKRHEEHDRIMEEIRLKGQEVIDLLKEYMPEYKDTLNLYESNYYLDYFNLDGYPTKTHFSFIIEDEEKGYTLEIRSDCILKKTKKEAIKIAEYVDEDIKKCSINNPWTWDDAIKAIKKQIEEKQNENK